MTTKYSSNNYRWATLFVLYCKGIALLLLALGALFLLSLILLGYQRTSGLAYKGDTRISLKVTVINGLASKIQDYFNDPKKGLSQITVHPLWSRTAYGSIFELSILQNDIVECRSSINSIRSNLSFQFLANSQKLIDALESHAKSIKPKAHGSGASPRIDAKIFIPSNIYKNGTDIKARLLHLSDAQDTFDALSVVSEKEESKQTINEAVKGLLKIQEFLEEQQSINQFSPHIRFAEPTQNGTSPLIDAERVAVKLSQINSDVFYSLSNDWLIDSELDDLEKVLNSEMESALNIRDQAISIWSYHLVMGTSFFLFTLFGGFFILVIADFVKAHIDNAESSVFIADLYRAGQSNDLK